MSFLREGANSIKFRAAGPIGDTVFFDTITSTSAAVLAEQNKLTFYTHNSGRQSSTLHFPNVRA